MAEPLGLIIDRNSDPKASDVYALVLNNTVVNTIIASYNDILAINRSYDYVVDVTMQGQSFASIGCAYNAGLDQFVRPPAPPFDWVENVREEFNSIISTVQQVLIDVNPQNGNLGNIDITAAFNSALNDNHGLSPGLLTIMTNIRQYILGGGG